jgi:hypothetical protein
LRKSLLQHFRDFGVVDQLALDSGRHRLPRQIVFGRSQPSAQHHHFRSRHGAPHRVRQTVQVVANNRFGHYFNA